MDTKVIAILSIIKLPLRLISFWIIILLCLMSLQVNSQSISAGELKKIKSDLKAASKSDFKNYDREKYLIRPITLMEVNTGGSDFLKINSYRKGKLMGPFETGTGGVYFIIKIQNGKTFKCNFYQLGVFQPFGVSDDVFDAEVNRVLQLCSRKRTNLKECMENYTSQSDVNFGEVMEPGWINAGNLRPEIAEFMRKCRKGEIFLTNKETINDVSFLNLLQRADRNQKVKTLTCMRIDLKSVQPEIQHTN